MSTLTKIQEKYLMWFDSKDSYTINEINEKLNHSESDWSNFHTIMVKLIDFGYMDYLGNPKNNLEGFKINSIGKSAIEEIKERKRNEERIETRLDAPVKNIVHENIIGYGSLLCLAISVSISLYTLDKSANTQQEVEGLRLSNESVMDTIEKLKTTLMRLENSFVGAVDSLNKRIDNSNASNLVNKKIQK